MQWIKIHAIQLGLSIFVFASGLGAIWYNLDSLVQKQHFIIATHTETLGEHNYAISSLRTELNKLHTRQQVIINQNENTRKQLDLLLEEMRRLRNGRERSGQPAFNDR